MTSFADRIKNLSKKSQYFVGLFLILEVILLIIAVSGKTFDYLRYCGELTSSDNSYGMQPHYLLYAGFCMNLIDIIGIAVLIIGSILNHKRSQHFAISGIIVNHSIEVILWFLAYGDNYFRWW